MKRYLFACLLLLLIPAHSNAQTDVTLTGTIKNFEKYMDKSNAVEIIIDDIALDDQVSYLAPIGKDGSFKVSFPKDQQQEIMFEYRGIVRVLVTPGDKMAISFDADDIDHSMTFTGDGAELNLASKAYELACSKYREQKYGAGRFARFNQLSKAEKDSNAVNFKKFIMDRFESERSFYTTYISANPVSEVFKKWAVADLDYECADALMRYAWINPYYSKNKGKLPADYYDFFTRFPLDNEAASISSSYGSYLHEYGSYLVRKMNQGNAGEIPVALLVKAIVNADKTLTPEEKKRMEAIALKELTTLSAEEGKFMQKIFEDHAEAVSAEMATLASVSLIDLYKKESSGFYRDVLLSNLFYGFIDAKELGSVKAHLAAFEADVKTDYLKKKILNAYYDADAKLRNYKLPANAIIREVPAEGDNFFNKLIEKYRGKVVYVDFWATWCGPCREEMPASKALRAGLKDKNVVFLYLGVESTENTWKSVIAELGIEGEHYLIKSNDYRALAQKFKISGIPHYVLVDQTGRVKDDNAKRPGEPDLKKEIEAMLKD